MDDKRGSSSLRLDVLCVLCRNGKGVDDKRGSSSQRLAMVFGM